MLIGIVIIIGGILLFLIGYLVACLQGNNEHYKQMEMMHSLLDAALRNNYKEEKYVINTKSGNREYDKETFLR
jgi:uncharacterized membrane protein YiaA